MIDVAENLKVYKLCDKCNKEFEIPTSPALIEGVVSTMANCTHCNETNHVWMRFVLKQEVKGETED